jgi:hypothetical protein
MLMARLCSHLLRVALHHLRMSMLAMANRLRLHIELPM